MAIRREQLLNKVSTTTNEVLDDSETVITVVDGSIFPVDGDYRLLLDDSEIILVTSRSGNDLTCERGVEESTAAVHSLGVDVDTIVTRGALDQLVNDITAGGLHRPARRIMDQSGTILTSTDFAWINQGSTTVSDDADGGITLKVVGTAGNFRILKRSAPTAPYKVRAKFELGFGGAWGTSGSIMGLLMRESATGKFVLCYYEYGEDCRPARYTDENTFSAFIAGANLAMADNHYVWMELEDDNTDIIFRYSSDGVNFYELIKEGRTAFMAGGPNEIGFTMHDRGSANKLLHLESWEEI